MNIGFYLLLLLSVFINVSCGKSSDKKTGSDASVEEAVEDEHNLLDQGIYRAVLRPVNQLYEENSSGTVEIMISGEEIVIQSNLVATSPGIKHFQNIMLSGTCPDSDADVNKDGVIDIIETMGVTGTVLIPLDSDVSDQFRGIDYGPIANGSGNYVYRRSALYPDLMADLQSPDPDPNDHIEKLSLDEALNLHKRVVLIHGVRSSSNLPDTVASIGSLTAEVTLPIACGRLMKIENEG